MQLQSRKKMEMQAAHLAHIAIPKNRHANALIFRFALIKIISHLVNFYGFGDNASLLDQNCS